MSTEDRAREVTAVGFLLQGGMFAGLSNFVEVLGHGAHVEVRRDSDDPNQPLPQLDVVLEDGSKIRWTWVVEHVSGQP